jgi:hypothetical protein
MSRSSRGSPRLRKLKRKRRRRSKGRILMGNQLRTCSGEKKGN